ncbi:UNVERIFIED_ORG: ATP-dependent DNA helicase RecQ [Martelella mediterranea]
MNGMTKHYTDFLQRCLSIDLEVNPKTAEIFAFAAVHIDKTPPLLSRKGELENDLDRLEAALDGVEFPVGHNFLRHDMEHLCASRPKLRNVLKAPIDTLWLNPLAFPRNPYHHLVKHYHDGRLQAGHINDPELDARLVFDVLANQLNAFEKLNIERPDAVTAYHFLTTRLEYSAGFDAVFQRIRAAGLPEKAEAFAAIRRLLQGHSCTKRLEQTLGRLNSPKIGWPMAYALAWISVAGGNSVMPPWVRAQFPEAALIIRHLRDTSCGNPNCAWCAEKNDPLRALHKWFGFEAFRADPVDKETERPLQEIIVDEAMSGRSLLGILPTGTGKSICYQIPALSRFDKTGALTVVISPLVALMGDQVQGMERAGISSAVTINGMLSMPERQDALDKVRMGEAAILIISPEQLRSVSVRSILAQREVGFWVLDEAHCVSKWGRDFRPDYRYIGRFIKEFSGDLPPAPVICLTATAKPEVARDIQEHFKSRVGIDLIVRDGGASRDNLQFDVIPTQKGSKLTDILNVISQKLPPDGASGAIVYCATRKETERVAGFLKQQGFSAEHYHAGLSPEAKRDIQKQFQNGDLRVIAATNAFGMGIDKPDIRLVVHGDIPGSLENYLQEAGRAGRDREPADCVLLFTQEDIERQFSLSARSRLARHEISAILKAMRRIDERTRKTGTIVATSGEIIRAEKDQEFARDSATDDTRIKTAVSWLEEPALVSREENRVQVYPSSLLVRTLEEAEALLRKAEITETRRRELLSVVRLLMNAPTDQGISTDELCGASGLSMPAMNKALADLETLRIARNDMALTAFVHVGVEGHSQARLDRVSRLEKELIDRMREMAPDVENEVENPLHLAEICQALRNAGFANARPDIVEKLLRGMARDGRDQDGEQGDIRLRKATRNTLMVALQRPWAAIDQTAKLRWQTAALLLDHLVGKVARGDRGKDIQVETTVGDLLSALTGDVLLQSDGIRDMTKQMERSLLWLHEQEVITLGKGLTVFRQAMTVHLNPEGGRFTQSHFLPLEEHYREQTIQTHVMAAYAERGIENSQQAERLSEDYFTLEQDAFLHRWLPGKASEIRRQTTSASWKAIVDELANRNQQNIVTDDREQTNVLVLAGPGSGKTRVLVHRIAYLLRVKREDPRGILVLSYNRHAVTEIRARLRHLIGDDAIGVTVSTCHALAMRLVGASFAGTTAETRDFNAIIMEAVRQLNGEGLSKSEAEAQRDALIQGYRWILVDEYQDIGPEEYALIAAVAGRSLADTDLRLSLFAVGDDDQNIYAFAGASIDYIRRFEEDYRARPEFLTENYRSTRHIIQAANDVIGRSRDRMKRGHDISINAGRSMEPAGGYMAAHDPIAQGRVQLLDCTAGDAAQAVAAVDELVRLSHLDPDWDWGRTAIIARNWKHLAPVRAYAEQLDIPVEVANEKVLNIWRLREMQTLIAELRREPVRMLLAEDVLNILKEQPNSRWTELITEGIVDLKQEFGEKSIPVSELVEWFAEWSQLTRKRQRGLLLLTGHRSKGLEFDHVVILNGGWSAAASQGEDADATRRLFYVSMTRARRTLAVMTCAEHPFLKEPGDNILRRKIPATSSHILKHEKHYQVPDLETVDLSYAGRLGRLNETLSAISQANVDDKVRLVSRDDRWFVLDGQNRVLGRMAKNWSPPRGHDFLEGHIGAVIRWRKTDNDEAYHHLIKRQEWETVLPELVFVRR